MSGKDGKIDVRIICKTPENKCKDQEKIKCARCY